MKSFSKKIWFEGEYNYRAAYGFVPEIHAYLHEDEEDRDCMLVVPGGGYCMCVPPEGELVAKEFYKRGFNAFVLTYTTDISFAVPLKKQPLSDISRAVRFIRSRASEYKTGKKLIVCGFSAGAHVAGSLAVHFNDIKDERYQEISNRPDGAILSYPVITTGEYTHRFSVQALLGPEPTAEELEYFSLEKQVTEDTVPCFIWQTATDELVPVENSYLMAEALKKKGVYYAHYVFPRGFHGLSAANEDFFSGNITGDYTMNQVMAAVKEIKDGRGVDVSEERVEQIRNEYPDKPVEQSDNGWQIDKSLKDDVGFWPSLAEVWIRNLPEQG